ncbi:MAG: PorT family protein [Tannerellaceae bacterium]|jgi:hypothetical protein|nr:PorT family protein [Tannerellaceae bacterium]
MKKKTVIRLSLFLVLTAISTNGFAQFYVGPNAGLVVSNFKNEYETEPGVGYMAGVSARYMFSCWGLKSGIYKIKKGVAISRGMVEVPGYTLDDTHLLNLSSQISLSYIEVPLSLTYMIPIERNIKLELNTGTYIAWGYESSGTLRIEGSGENFSLDFFRSNVISVQNLSDFAYKPVSHFDYGYIIGMSLDISKINIGVNYAIGIGDMYQTSHSISLYPQSGNVKNSAFYIHWGYNFKL